MEHQNPDQYPWFNFSETGKTLMFEWGCLVRRVTEGIEEGRKNYI